MRNVLLACGIMSVAAVAFAADLPPPLELTAEQDHKLMMDQLGITSIRQGANGRDPNAANAANYDESKGNPYPELPDALKFDNGKPVRNAQAVVEQAASGDRRALRSRGVRQDAKARARGELGGR